MSQSLFGGLLPIWSTTTLWILVKPLRLRLCSASPWEAPKTAVAAASIGQQNGPSSFPRQCPTTGYTTNASKVEQNGLQSFASSTIFTWPLTNWLPLLQAFQELFARKTLPQPAGGRKCSPRVPQIPKHGFLHSRNKQTYFLSAKTHSLHWFLFWLIKTWLSLVVTM